MTPEHIAELDRLERAATPGPWTPDADVNDQAVLGPKGRMVADCAIFSPGCKDSVMTANGRLVAAMRNALPDLLRIARSQLADEASATAAPQAADPAGLGSRIEKSTPHPIPHESPKEG